MLYPTTSRVYFYIPTDKDWRNISKSPTPSRVYFYIPVDKEGYTKPRIIPHTLTGILLYTRNNQGTSHATTPYNHMGILLCTCKQKGAN